MAVLAEIRARRAETSSEGAVAAATRSADALEEANRFARAANPSDVPPWSTAEWVSGETFSIRNDSKRVAIVEDIEPDTDRLADLLRHRVSYPFRVDPGDSVPVICVGVLAGRPSPTLVWHWEGDAEIQRTRRGVIKP